MWLPSRLWTLWKWRGLFREQLRQVQAAGEWIADELEANAKKIRAPRYTQDFSASSSLDLRYDAWQQHGPTLHALSRPEPELWEDVRGAYALLDERGGDVSPDALVDLAARLRAAMHRLDQRKPARAEPMDQRPDPAVIARLRTHYSADAALLERLVGPVPGVTDVT